MKYLAHRGEWFEPSSKNSKNALVCALKSGFGVETDIRDHSGCLVLSHDPPIIPTLTFDSFLEEYHRLPSNAPLALNIKADGIARWIKNALTNPSLTNYFCFDMSTPETIVFRKLGLRYFTRESEFEKTPVLYENAAGVWMDQFEGEWITPKDIQKHHMAGKQVAIVSPELHGRDPIPFWNMLRENGVHRNEELMLCTDLTSRASEFFQL
jgi:hypothetical protein